MLELLVGGAAIWFVAHPSPLPTPPPAVAPDALPDESVGGAPGTDSGTGGRPDTVATVAPSRRTGRLQPAVPVPSGHLFRSIEDRARAGERVAVSVTAYCLQGRTRRGNPVRAGIIAVDRALFPLGREVELFFGRRSYGRFLADDTGGAIKGGRIDVWMSDCTAARRFGRRRGYAQLVRKETPAR
ncbi:MAG: 3D domain-containing protein [Gemmatimonadaceae bacterium]|nr:3D domain-containing protein [Gemmatimonadaceae bacterium]